MKLYLSQRCPVEKLQTRELSDFPHVGVSVNDTPVDGLIHLVQCIGDGGVGSGGLDALVTEDGSRNCYLVD